jgi:3' exoribonuclease, RNase T-like
MTPTKHISIDIETMGVKANAAIISIGAVLFDPQETVVAALGGGTFYRKVDLASSIRAGLQVDASTIMWWMQQSDDARAEFARKDKDNPRNALYEVLGDLVTWFEAHGGYWGPEGNSIQTPMRGDLRVWAKGPDFDCVILESAFAACQLKTPWKYSEKRDVRTICEAAGVEPNDFTVGTKHNALVDAVAQARAVQEAHQRLWREFCGETGTVMRKIASRKFSLA